VVLGRNNEVYFGRCDKTDKKLVKREYKTVARKYLIKSTKTTRDYLC
jgi:hypothetical protein